MRPAYRHHWPKAVMDWFWAEVDIREHRAGRALSVGELNDLCQQAAKRAGRA
jgi:hypothetical protein